jgi:hypothetical protein
MRARVATLLVGVAVLTACGGGGGGRVQTRAPVTSVPTLPSTPASPGGPSVTVGIICSTPTEAAQALVNAWMAADQAAAGRCASPAAVATLFARTRAAWTFQGCDGPDPGVPQCTFAYSGGHASLTLAGTEAQGWRVDHVSFGP